MLKRFPRVYDVPNPAGKSSPEKPSGDVGTSPHMYSLYFKGLVSEQHSSAGFGVAICGQKDDVLFQTKGPIFGLNITVMEAELTALKRGLTEAADMGINHITIYNDSYSIHELVTGRSMPKENNAAMLLNDVQRIRERFSSSFPIFVAEESIKYAYKLAREAIDSEISIPMDPLRQTKPVKKVTCRICLDDDINADQMFTVGKCRHRFCSECVKRHIEVRLLEGSMMTCPYYRCKFKLSLKRCVHLLTPEVTSMWQERIRQEMIPFADRVYCPNPRCSDLMRKTEISKPSGDGGGGVKSCCFKCGEALCINCKVPWHSDLSCDDYKMLHPDATENDGKLKSLANQRRWRQCTRCQNMIELSQGCVKVTCRCGYNFCYQCGAGAGLCSHAYDHSFPPLPVQEPIQMSPMCLCFSFCLCVVGFSLAFGLPFIFNN